MNTEQSAQSAASALNFVQVGQALTQACLDFVTKQQLAVLLPASAPLAPSAPLPMPNLEPLASLQQELATGHAHLVQKMMESWSGMAPEPVVRPEGGDRLALIHICRCRREDRWKTRMSPDH